MGLLPQPSKGASKAYHCMAGGKGWGERKRGCVGGVVFRPGLDEIGVHDLQQPNRAMEGGARRADVPHHPAAPMAIGKALLQLPQRGFPRQLLRSRNEHEWLIVKAIGTVF